MSETEKHIVLHLLITKKATVSFPLGENLKKISKLELFIVIPKMVEKTTHILNFVLSFWSTLKKMVKIYISDENLLSLSKEPLSDNRFIFLN